MARINLRTAASIGTKTGSVTEVSVTATFEERSTAIKAAIDSGQPIAVPFTKFNDGRGFSVARLLRSEHNYRGEIIATGHTIPDQALHLLRSGFDMVEVADASRLSQWLKSLASYGGAYQTAARNPMALRRNATLALREAKPHTPLARQDLRGAGVVPIREIA